MSEDLPVRHRDPDHLLRLHDELDDLSSSGLGWKSASVLSVIVGVFLLAVVRLGTSVGIGIEFAVILLAGIGTVAGIGVAKRLRAGSLRRAIRELEEKSSTAEKE